MKNINLVILCIFMLGCTLSYAQTSTDTPTRQTDDPRNMVRERQQTGLRLEALRKMGDSGGLAEDDLIKNSAKYINFSKRDKELTSIYPADEEKYEEFLDSPKTGFVRFHDSAVCNESRSVINANGPCPWGITGKATAFSFRKNIYTVSVFSDIQNYAGSFQIAGINQLGFLTNLGDVALETLNLQSPGIKAMGEFQPTGDVEAIKFQYNLAKNGFVVGDFVYKSAVPIEVNKTYALRSIAFQGKAYRTFGNSKIDIFDGDERKDIIIVFRVIRKHADGSFSIIWKELWRDNSPTVAAEK